LIYFGQFIDPRGQAHGWKAGGDIVTLIWVKKKKDTAHKGGRKTCTKVFSKLA